MKSCIHRLSRSKCKFMQSCATPPFQFEDRYSIRLSYECFFDGELQRLRFAWKSANSFLMHVENMRTPPIAKNQEVQTVPRPNPPQPEGRIFLSTWSREPACDSCPARLRIGCSCSASAAEVIDHQPSQSGEIGRHARLRTGAQEQLRNGSGRQLGRGPKLDSRLRLFLPTPGNRGPLAPRSISDFRKVGRPGWSQSKVELVRQ